MKRLDLYLEAFEGLYCPHPPIRMSPPWTLAGSASPCLSSLSLRRFQKESLREWLLELAEEMEG